MGDDIQSGSRDGFEVSGYRRVCDELDIKLVNLKESGFRETSVSGLLLDKTFISPLVLGADFIINLPKLKTHSFTVFTGAVKNMFGVIPYGLRLDYHLKYYLPDRFCRMLVDIARRVKPHLTIMDGITAMEGEGPGAGNPRQVGVLIAGRDPVAVDAVACRLIGLRPLDIYSTLDAHERGVGRADLDEMTILGEDVDRLRVEDFKHSAVAVGLMRKRVPQFLYAYLQAQLANIPEVLPEKCTDCGECVQVCPTGAAQQRRDKAWIQEDLCIHCMCCHEVCRFRAIKLKQSPTGRLIRGGMTVARRIKKYTSILRETRTMNL